ncbi:MAG TPA: NUDIX domain-containing protein [Planctomycetota bacterium]|nr:NUDIX domain-containing protein [Planctomycetota bacterium]
MKVSAGCLVRAEFPDGPRFLLVHPSGNYNRRAPWSIPKGEMDEGEAPEACALRETLEETGVECRILRPLGEVHYRKSRKRIIAFLAEPVSPPSTADLKPASWELDAAKYLPDEEARQVIHPDQAALLDRGAADQRELTDQS